MRHRRTVEVPLGGLRGMTLDAVAVQPLPPGITAELEMLKRRLADMGAADISVEQTRLMATEIGAIRLQLKRLQLDQQALSGRLAR